MKKMGLLVYKLFMFVYLVAIFVVFIMATKMNNDAILISASVLIGFLILMNLIHILINFKRVHSVKLINNNISSTNLHPLELYIIDCIWNNKKKKFNKRQAYGAILYEIENGNLIYTGTGIKISPNVDIANLPIYSLITMEMSLLNRIGCRKTRRLKIHDLKEIQKDDATVIMEDLLSNIDGNCQDVEIFSEQMNLIKKQHFREIESKKTVYLTLVSWICVFASLIFMVKNINDGNVLNLYLPVGLAVILAATLTSKYRERVVIQRDDREFISDALNYMENLKRLENTRINEIYSYSIGIKDSQLVSIFK
jgi:hypothetical protein